MSFPFTPKTSEQAKHFAERNVSLHLNVRRMCKAKANKVIKRKIPTVKFSLFNNSREAPGRSSERLSATLKPESKITNLNSKIIFCKNKKL